MRLVELNALYDCADFVYQNGVTCHIVPFEEAGRFAENCRNLRFACKEKILPPAWQALSEIQYRLLYRISRTICSPAFLVELMKKELAEAYRAAEAQKHTVSPEIRDLLHSSIGLLAGFSKLSDSPVRLEFERIIEESIARKHRKVIFVQRDRFLWDETIRMLEQYRGKIRVVIRKPRELREHPRVDRLLLCGPLSVLTRFNEEYLIRAPVADEIDSISLEHERAAAHASILTSEFGSGSRFHINRHTVAGSKVVSGLAPVADIPDEEFLVEEQAGVESNSPSSSSIQILAKRCLLGGGYGTYLSAESEGAVYVPHCRQVAGVLTCVEVEKIPVTELEPGSLIVLTTEGSGDLIEPYADLILKDKAKHYRALQNAWKAPFRELVERIGMDGMMGLFTKAGATDLNHANIKNWCDPRNIAPANLDLHFAIILRLTDRERHKNSHLEAITHIRRAHTSAGFQLHGKIRDMLVGMDLRPVLRDGLMVVRPEADGPAKTIFLVERLSQNLHCVSGHYIGRVMKLRHEEVAV